MFVTGEWHQNNIIGGNNTFLVQYANGALSGMGGGAPGFNILGLVDCTTPGRGCQTDKNNYQFRVIDQLLLQPSAQLQVLVGGMYQIKQFGDATNKNGGTNTKVNQYGIFARPVYYFNDYFKLQGDIGYTATDATNAADNANYSLFKFTVAPTLSHARHRRRERLLPAPRDSASS